MPEKVPELPYDLIVILFDKFGFEAIALNPSIRQSILWSPSFSLIFFTLVPALIDLDVPFTGKFLIVTTVSPFWSTTPFASFTS